MYNLISMHLWQSMKFRCVHVFKFPLYRSSALSSRQIFVVYEHPAIYLKLGYFHTFVSAKAKIDPGNDHLAKLGSIDTYISA